MQRWLRRGACTPSLLLLLAVAVSSQSYPPDPIQPCSYGSLPGVWRTDAADAGSRWRTLAPGCQLKNLVAQVGRGMWPRSRTGPNDDVGILFLGDSVDGYFVADACPKIMEGMLWPNDLGGAGICCHNKFALNNCRGSPSNLVLAQHYVFSLSLDGQTHDEVLTGKGNVIERSDKALEKYDELFSDPPRMVVLNANFWDVVRITKHDSHQLNKHYELSDALLNSWMANFTTWVQHLTTKLPKETLLLYHTVPLHVHNPETGLTADHSKVFWYRSKALATQLNAAGREAARRLGLGLLDLELMVASKTPAQYLRDEKHPNELVVLEALNVLLNMLEQWYAVRAGGTAGAGGGTAANGTQAAAAGVVHSRRLRRGAA